FHPAKRSPLVTEEEIRLMIEVGREEGVLADEERKMLHRIFEFGETSVEEVMVPKEKIIAIEIGAQPDELLELVVEEGHSRIPVYRESIEHITGIIYARDLLHIWRNKSLIVIPDLIHPAYYIRPGKKVNDLLADFQLKKIQIAIVVNDEGNTLGLVTLEDLTEEIVGEVEEEHKIRPILSE
ncbi:MAG: CBS domain-containing protein, partial [Candidatus Omnitrophica bacterium]|nr:CBS domain-containing protein [Candidatus Omnitrophota bacterium]